MPSRVPLPIFVLTLPCMASAEPVSFSRDVLPILSDNGLSCHDQHGAHGKADLRLDTREGAHEVIRSGDRIVTDDSEEFMLPPPKSHKPKLKSEQIGLMKR